MRRHHFPLIPLLLLTACASTGELASNKPPSLDSPRELLKGLRESAGQKTAKQGNHTRNSAANPTADLLAYKARPLNGTWASAPYLHNGSVPTLYALLLPPAERPRTFSVGRWEYDPKQVGYVSDGTAPFVFDTRVTGNSNRGHEYGVTLSEADRWALVEYLKTL